MQKSILVCDNFDEFNSNYDLVINWNSFNEDAKTYSIPKEIEKNANKYKKQYLDWIEKFGCTKLSGKTVKNHLMLRDDFSLWWMSLIVEKNKWKSPGIYKVFQLLALNEILIKIEKIEKIEKIDINISDKNASRSIYEWCIKYKIQCNLIQIKKSIKFKFSYNDILNYRPYFLSAIFWLFAYSITRWPRNKIIADKNPQTFENEGICIMSYFFNIDKAKADENSFYTFYWTKLHDLLINSKKPINWIHLYVKSNEFPNYKSANILIDKLNDDPNKFERHRLIDNYLSFDIIKKTLKDYSRLFFIGRQLKNIKSHFRISNTGINFWNVFCDSWNCSLFGKTAISNCLYLNLFEKIFNELPNQSQGLYLLENQPWEKSMIYSWRKYGHGEIIGVPHAAVSYWDLRYSFHPNEYLNFNNKTSPLPNTIALNGMAAINMYTENGLPLDRIKKVEALRYLYLSDLNINSLPSSNNPINLLVLGGHVPKSNQTQMELLISALDFIDFELNILIKPHPLSPIQESDYPELNFQVTLSPLGKIISKYDIVFSSNQTAAAVDVYLSQKKVIIMQETCTFNMSALKGFKGVAFVRTARELAECLSENTDDSSMLIDKDFYYLDNELPKWRNLLKIS